MRPDDIFPVFLEIVKRYFGRETSYYDGKLLDHMEFADFCWADEYNYSFKIGCDGYSCTLLVNKNSLKEMNEENFREQVILLCEKLKRTLHET